MGGRVFPDVVPVTLNVLEKNWNDIKARLSSANLSDITPIGTTFKKDVMSDIDVAAKTDDVNWLVDILHDIFGSSNVKRTAGRTISIRYKTIDKELIQIDVMTGDPHYLLWARFGPSTNKIDGRHSSVVKGNVRNIFLNTVLRYTTGQSSAYNLYIRERLALDFDVGLRKIVQTKIGGDGNELKRYKTISSSLISTDPDEITRIIFGHGTREDSLTFECCVSLLYNSPTYKELAQEILREFVLDLEEISPHLLKSDVDLVSYVKSFIK